MKLWAFAAGMVAIAAFGLTAWRARRRKGTGAEFSTEPLSGQWLADARSHEDHTW